MKVNNHDVERAYTATQGQYLALIYYYTKLHGVPPFEADMQRYFKVSSPCGPQHDRHVGEAWVH